MNENTRKINEIELTKKKERENGTKSLFFDKTRQRNRERQRDKEQEKVANECTDCIYLLMNGMNNVQNA